MNCPCCWGVPSVLVLRVLKNLRWGCKACDCSSSLYLSAHLLALFIPVCPDIYLDFFFLDQLNFKPQIFCRSWTGKSWLQCSDSRNTVFVIDVSLPKLSCIWGKSRNKLRLKGNCLWTQFGLGCLLCCTCLVCVTRKTNLAWQQSDRNNQHICRFIVWQWLCVMICLLLSLWNAAFQMHIFTVYLLIVMTKRYLPWMYISREEVKTTFWKTSQTSWIIFCSLETRLLPAQHSSLFGYMQWCFWFELSCCCHVTMWAARWRICCVFAWKQRSLKLGALDVLQRMSLPHITAICIQLFFLSSFSLCHRSAVSDDCWLCWKFIEIYLAKKV